MINNNVLDKKHYDVLFVFASQSNPYKVALDKSGRVIELYEQIASHNVHIKTWLDLMSMKPSSFEVINVETRSVDQVEEIFLTVCSMTNNEKKMIVYSHQGKLYERYYINNSINFNGTTILVLDRDQAYHELNQSNTYNIADSQVAINHSSITDSKNKGFL